MIRSPVFHLQKLLIPVCHIVPIPVIDRLTLFIQSSALRIIFHQAKLIENRFHPFFKNPCFRAPCSRNIGILTSFHDLRRSSRQYFSSSSQISRGVCFLYHGPYIEYLLFSSIRSDFCLLHICQACVGINLRIPAQRSIEMKQCGLRIRCSKYLRFPVIHKFCKIASRYFKYRLSVFQRIDRFCIKGDLLLPSFPVIAVESPVFSLFYHIKISKIIE